MYHFQGVGGKKKTKSTIHRRQEEVEERNEKKAWK